MCSVKEGERAEGREVRPEKRGRGTKTGSGSFGRLREGSPRDSGPGHHERGGRGEAGTHKGRLYVERGGRGEEGTHKGRPYMEKTAGDDGDDEDVSTLPGRCVQFWARCVNFLAECVQFRGNVSTLVGEVSRFSAASVGWG